jgi:hypothetical protein
MKSVLLFIRQRAQFNLQEISGGFGDLGTFIPLSVSLVLVCGMDAGSLLFWAGLFNIITGLVFGLPIPIQPMKAIVAVAIAEKLSTGQIAAAGIGTALCLLLLCPKDWLSKLTKIIPNELVRGIQVGVGIKLIIKGLAYIGNGDLSRPSNWLLIITGVIIIGAGLKTSKIPAAFLVFSMGLAGVYIANPNLYSELNFGWNGLALTIPETGDWISGFTKGAIPQIPLTLLNSVIAVCALSGTLFPGKKIPEKKMALSVVFMNLIGCWFGAMPMCHGSGGLAAQYRFGGRTGGCVIVVGILKMIVGIAFGSAVITFLAGYPVVLLGLLLIVSGSELSRSLFNNKKAVEYIVCIVTALLIVKFNTVVGLAAGVSFRWIVVKVVAVMGEN